MTIRPSAAPALPRRWRGHAALTGVAIAAGAAGAGLIALLAIVGLLGSAGPSDDDLTRAYQDGFAAAIAAADLAAGATAPTTGPPQAPIRLLPGVRDGRLVEVSEECFQSPVLGCEEIY